MENEPKFVVLAKRRPKGRAAIHSEHDDYDVAMRVKDELLWELNRDEVTTSVVVVEL